ncbi:hypothetical protein PIB30_077722 [Stylosanthes scabra]|uniref:Transposase, Ptta/En/Spm, plant n=1 Tax=Stylosanthes scabra TaxID=79078 RepID=A0ABU6XQA8_9FABA|nr:hypothetical protein [Stylosanthes scabra]
MPKQNRYNNLLKAAAASPSQDKSAAAASSSQACQQASANPPTIQPSITSSTNSGTSSRTSSMAPTSFEDSSRARHKRGRESKRYWKVHAIDEYGVIIEEHLLAKDVHNLAEGLRIIVNFDEFHAAIREATGLHAGVCGQLASDCVAFQTSFEKWSSIPDSFFQNQWNSFFSVRFCFKESDQLAKHFFLQSLSKKWREHRLKLWNEFHDPRLSKTQLIKNVAADIVADQWALYVEYRLKLETQKDETGKKVSRAGIWGIAHKKKDRSYVNQQAKEITEKIEAHCTQQSVDSTINSPLDALGVVFGKEHPGRVRGLGMGVVPMDFSDELSSSNDIGTSSTCSSSVQDELNAIKAQLQALASYIASKEGRKLPEHLVAMFPNEQAAQELIQGSEFPSPRELGSKSSGASNKET